MGNGQRSFLIPSLGACLNTVLRFLSSTHTSKAQSSTDSNLTTPYSASLSLCGTLRLCERERERDSKKVRTREREREKGGLIEMKHERLW